MPDLSRDEYVEILTSLLQENTFFGEFPEIAAGFARRAEFNFYQQGARVINQGDANDHRFFVVISGQLRAIDMTDAPPRLLNYLDRASIFGTRALLNEEPRSATVEVIVDSRLATFDRDDWAWLIHQNDRIEVYFRNLERKFEEPGLQDFPGRQFDEVVVIAVKRHVLALLAKLPIPLALLIVPVLFLIAAELWGIRLIGSSLSDLFLTALVIVPFVILAVVLAIYYYLDWRNDDFIVTTKRVIHIERVLLYGEQRDEAPLIRVQDVTVITFDLLERFFDYHDLALRTAGAGTIRLNGIPRANEIRDAIFRERARARARVSASEVGTLRQLIAQRLDWEDALERPVVAVAEEEAIVETPEQTHHLPAVIDYFWPRVKEVNEDEEEGTVIVWRKHYFVLLATIFFPLVAVLTSLYLFIAGIFALAPFGASVSIPILAVLGIAFLASAVWYLLRYDDWTRDRYIVTNSRIVDVEATPFRLRGEQRREGTFDNIQNITYDIPNLLSQLLNLGDVIIETAGTEQTFTFDKVFDPSGVQEEIFNRMVRYQQRQREQYRDANADQLVNILAEYHHLFERMSRSRSQEQ